MTVCNDYLDRRHDDVNRRRIASGAPWMLLAPRGERPLVGPVFRPAEQGPCWACLVHRLRGHREIHEFVRRLAGDDRAPAPRVSEPVVVDAVYDLAAAEIAKWLVLDALAPLHENVISLDVLGLQSGQHVTVRRPAVPRLRRRGAVSPRPPAGAGAVAAESQARAQQRRGALGAPRGDPGPLPAPDQSGPAGNNRCATPHHTPALQIGTSTGNRL